VVPDKEIILSSSQHGKHMKSVEDCWISVNCPSLKIDFFRNVLNDDESTYCQGYIPVNLTKWREYMLRHRTIHFSDYLK
jgi:lipopolysaccharide biosynthesis glycosyltransferase